MNSYIPQTTECDLATGELALGERPALILVDMSNGFTSSESPLGGEFESVINANKQLLDEFRQCDLPVFFTSVVYSDDLQASVFRTRLPALNILQAGSEWVQIHESLTPLVSETVIEKQGPSGFFQTQLAGILAEHGADSLVITGLTTSGCVRATVVDGLQHNYPVFVPAEACGDRNQAAQQANLHDMHAKYAVVTSVGQILSSIKK